VKNGHSRASVKERVSRPRRLVVDNEPEWRAASLGGSMTQTR
jgi:hypothetical protein